MWLRRLRRAEVSDAIWLTRSAQWHGIQEELREALITGASVLVFAHFQSALDDLQRLLASNMLQHEVLDARVDLSAFVSRMTYRSRPIIYLALSEGLEASYAEPFIQTAHMPLAVFVIDHYPLEDRDRRILSFARARGVDRGVRFHSSLDDPLLKLFAGENVADFIQRHSRDERKPVEAMTLVSSIRAAQRKIFNQTPGTRKARSVEDWFRHNLLTGK